jgi:hypothetical protein
VVLECHNVGMFRSEDLELDFEHLMVGVFGLVMLPSGRAKGGQVVLHDGDFVVPLPVPVLPDSERVLESLLGLGVPALVITSLTAADSPALDDGVITDDDIRAAIAAVIDDSPSDNDLRAVSAPLAAAGWPFGGNLGHTRPTPG